MTGRIHHIENKSFHVYFPFFTFKKICRITVVGIGIVSGDLQFGCIAQQKILFMSIYRYSVSTGKTVSPAAMIEVSVGQQHRNRLQLFF